MENKDLAKDIINRNLSNEVNINENPTELSVSQEEGEESNEISEINPSILEQVDNMNNIFNEFTTSVENGKIPSSIQDLQISLNDVKFSTELSQTKESLTFGENLADIDDPDKSKRGDIFNPSEYQKEEENRAGQEEGEESNERFVIDPSILEQFDNIDNMFNEFTTLVENGKIPSFIQDSQIPVKEVKSSKEPSQTKEHLTFGENLADIDDPDKSKRGDIFNPSEYRKEEVNSARTLNSNSQISVKKESKTFKRKKLKKGEKYKSKHALFSILEEPQKKISDDKSINSNLETLVGNNYNPKKLVEKKEKRKESYKKKRDEIKSDSKKLAKKKKGNREMNKNNLTALGVSPININNAVKDRAVNNHNNQPNKRKMNM